MKKIILILLALMLSACMENVSSSQEILSPENDSINAGTVIKYNTIEGFEGKRTLMVNNVTLLFNDRYYTFAINDSLNYKSDNDYFYTGDILVSLVSRDEREYGVYEDDDVVISVEQLDEKTDIIIKGKDLDSIKTVLSNIYLSDSIYYQMFDHEIAEEWTKEVIITDDVVSFFNGEDTVYIYHNEGSPDGPTVFYKQLDDIDIPITYPEEGFGFNYIPYGFTEYEHLRVEGYTPYSAYDLGIVEPVLQEKTALSQMDTYKKEATEYGSAFIILAKDDETVYSLFNDKTDKTTSSILSVEFNNTSLADISIEEKPRESLSAVIDIAKEVINSDNRYHTQLLLEDGKDVTLTFNSVKTGDYFTRVGGLYNYLTKTTVEVSDKSYYVDGQEGYIAPPQSFYIQDQYEKGYVNPGMPGTVTETIYGGMYCKLIIPTLKLICPAYKESTSTMGKYKDPINFGMSARYDSAYVLTNDQSNYISPIIDAHGRACSAEFLKYKGFLWYTNFGMRDQIQIGDFVYLRKENTLEIFRCERNEVVEWASYSSLNYLNELSQNGLLYDLYTRSCNVVEYVKDGKVYENPGIMNAYELVAVINLAY